MMDTVERHRGARRRAIGAIASAIALAAAGAPAIAFGQADPTRVEVWKSPTCGCCADWVKHMEQNGFKVQVFDTGNTTMRGKLGMPEKFGSCHTARVGGYVIEGHVPAREIKRLLQERPTAIGLSVPGMPIGSPGMDDPVYGDRKDPYDVVLVARDGAGTVFASYR
jgi:hypothetical protein